MCQGIIVQRLKVGKHIELPFFKIFSRFQDKVPLPSTSQVQHLHDSFFILFQLVLINLNVISVELLQEVIQVSLKPKCSVIAALSRNVQPCLCLHILGLIIRGHVHCEIVQLIILYYLDNKLSLLLDRVRDV